MQKWHVLKYTGYSGLPNNSFETIINFGVFLVGNGSLVLKSGVFHVLMATVQQVLSFLLI